MASDSLLKSDDPAVLNAKQFIFYGLSGAPPTKAHRNILKTIAELFPGPDNMVILVPTSNLYNKESVKCTKDYTYGGSDLRIELHKKMVELLNKDNIRISLHEQGVDGGMGTYDSIKALHTILQKPILMIWGQDSVEDILGGKWKNRKDLLDMIDRNEITAVYIPRGASPLTADMAWYKILQGSKADTIITKFKNISEIIGAMPEEKQREIIAALKTTEAGSSTSARKLIREGNIAALSYELDTEIIDIILKYDDNKSNPKPIPYSTPDCEKPQTAGRYRKSKAKSKAKSKSKSKGKSKIKLTKRFSKTLKNPRS